MKNKKCVLLSIIGMLFLIGASSQTNAAGYGHRDKGYFIVFEEDTENEIFATSWDVEVGDKYHSTDNKMYEIIQVNKDHKRAYACFVEDIKMPDLDEILVAEAMQVTKKEKTVALYFSHNAKSYIPSDGTDSKSGHGGIIRVGEAFKKGFEDQGVKAIINKTSHEPHDANSYIRSRRTAVELLRKRPDALFDIHRDAIPKEYYLDTIDGTPVSKVRIVLGRRNQNLQANEELARKIKAVSDEAHPGFVRDIFYAKGNYNQDLAPRALLFEFGTYEHTRERAEKGAGIFAGIVTKALFGGTVKKGEKMQKAQGVQHSSKGSSSGILSLIAVVGLGGLAYLILSTGGREISSKIKDFVKTEFGSPSARKDKGDDNERV